MELEGKKVLVLGLGDTGMSMARWLARRGADVRVADSREEPPHAAAIARTLPRVPVSLGAFRKADFEGVDLIAVSPGIDRRHHPVADALARGVPAVGDVELFACALPELGSPRILAVTGSNGKSTVTAMAGDICRAGGLDTVVAGNIGVPVLDTLTEIEAGRRMPDTFVLELSSFQLESTSSLAPAAATMLNLSEDHLDRYDGMADYAEAKARIFSGGGVQVLNRDDAWSLGMRRPQRRCTTFGFAAPRGEDEWGISAAREPALARGGVDVMPLAALPVTGLHNAANALAAAALAREVGVPDESIALALRAFRGLPHRVQKIAEIGGVAYYDDSKGTNVGASVAALAGMPMKVVLIAGGDGKGQDFSPLAPAATAHARAVVLIGRDADAIERVLAPAGVRTERASSMIEAVEVAQRLATEGDAVLLSPACASFDMFRSYVHRAEVFAAAVNGLARKAG